MNSLKVPDSGLVLNGAPDGEPAVPPQAFVVDLDDSVVDQMIQSARNGQDMHLSLGQNPTLHYGSRSHRVAPPADNSPFDLFLTKPFESTRRAGRIPNTGSLFKKFGPRPSKKQPAKEASAKPKPAASAPAAKSSASSGLDSDIEALQNGLAAHEAARERTHLVDRVPVTKNAPHKAKGKPRAQHAGAVAAKTMATSPALPAPQSPALSASQQVLERKKEQRVVLVHELAARARSTEYLRRKWTGKPDDFLAMMEKTADYDSESKTWTIRKSGWKELDVWKYDYASKEDRQAAIDNAIRQYDKQRLSSSEVEWQRLLPVEERGRGKCLSRLQANLARGLVEPASKMRAQKADESSASREEESSSDKAKAGAADKTLPARATTKKPTAKSAQVKRLLGKPKPAAPKPAPTRAKAGGAKGSGGGGGGGGSGSGSGGGGGGARVLSAAIITNSDSSGDEAPARQPAKAKSAAPKPKDTVVVNTKPLPARETTTTTRPPQPAKRPLEGDESSSSSGTPLSKRIKAKQPLPAPVAKARVPKAGPASLPAARRVAAPSGGAKVKSTSPTKSSPLASSPPTNASDLEEEGRAAAAAAAAAASAARKRKMDGDGKPAAKRRAGERDVPAEVLDKASVFQRHYATYAALHTEVSALADPPQSKLDDLLDIRGRLESLKKEIYEQCPRSRE